LFLAYNNIFIAFVNAGHTENLMTGFDVPANLSVKMLPVAFYSGLWAYDGW